MARILASLACLVGSLTGAHAQTFNQVAVGVGPGCNFSSIQAAIDAAPAGSTQRTTVRVTRSLVYLQQKIVINGKNVVLRGGYADCQQVAPDAILTRIDGVGGATGSVVEFKGLTDDVGLTKLEITGGDASLGGGVHVHEGPHTRVLLSNLFVHDNAAASGGGVYVAQPGTVQLESVRLENNTATSIGGGLGCADGIVQVFGTSSVRNNTATGGGGIAASGGLTTCRIDFTSDAPFAIYNNNAGSGGGVSAFRAQVRLYTSNPLAPVAVLGNTASAAGGGISVGALGRVGAYNVVIAANSAPIGGGVNVDSTGILVGFPQLAVFVASSLPPIDLPNAVAGCDPGFDCNRISGNAAINGTSPGAGAAFHLRRRAEVYLEGTRVNENEGISLVQEQDDEGQFIRFKADGALIDHNRVTALALAAGANQRVQLSNSTIAQNVLGGAAAFFVENQSAAGADLGFSMGHSIYWQPGRPLVAGSGIQDQRVRYNIVSSLVGVNSGDTLFNRTSDPLFIDAANGNFRLQSTSLGIDTAPSSGGFTRDGGLRDIDIDGLNNSQGTLWGGGPRDMGAYEASAESLLAIFKDGYE